MNKIVGILRLTRIEHSIMLVVAVLAAELIVSGGLPAPFILAMSLVSPIFISMAAFAINDYFDITVDRLNKKDRPLINGTLRPKDALYVTAASLVIGILASALINIYCLAIAVVFGALALLYSYRLKETLLWGNAYVAFSMAIPFLFGDYVVSDRITQAIALVFAMIFTSGLAREINGSIRDLKGDMKARNVRSVPRVFGIGAAAKSAFLLYVAAVVISIYLFLYVAPFKLDIVYAVPIAITDIILLYVGVIYSGREREKLYMRARNLSLAAMGIALLALLVTPLFPLAHI